MKLRLGEWREHRRLSFRQLASRSGVSFVTLYRIEAGKMSPTVAMLEKLAKALHISVREMFPAGKRTKTKEKRLGQER